ncbi:MULTISPECIES: arylesterase [Marinobacter]|uniref:Arylesterase n=2 Tax=Marinobacter TaxID=2742 RepID=A0A455WFT7_MARNT|nr:MULTISPECIES: arylesterase [unclassified Marinobacter]QFS87367.1 Esterase TesA precursor [Marinobacter sp. THAF197a]QFT51151.1 Esterase TesA precursor [Marinobacter sp. THAF39]BBJ04358.1 arylesterase [Marinobacter nauticus]
MNTVSALVRSFALSALMLLSLSALASQNTLLVVGDSLSAAYGVPSETAWVQLLRDRLDEQGLNWNVVNASISGETTDGGLRRLPDLLQKNQPDVVIIELGGNDGLRGFPPNVIESNLADMIEQVRDVGAIPVLVGMQIPPNYGQRYTRMFADIFPNLSDRYDTPLVPFFLEGIYNADGLMQEDGIHPTEAAQPVLLDNVWPQLEPLILDRNPSALRSDQ